VHNHNGNRLNFRWRGIGLIALTLLLFVGGIEAANEKARLVNRPPVISVPDSQWVAEGDRLFFQVTATDPDTTDILELSYSLEGGGSPPQGCQFEQRQIERGTFAELKGTPGMPLLNYRLIGVDGETGEVYSTVIISGGGDILMPGDGYYVIAHDSSVGNWDLINSNVDWQNANGAGDNILLLNASGDTLDALGYGPAETSGWFFCGEDSPATDVTFNHSLGRYPDGTDTDNNSIDFYDYAVPTPGVGNGSPKSNKSTLVINEVRYETSDHYQKGSFSWNPDYTEGGVYKFVFVVEDNGAPQLTDTGEVVVTVTESALDTVITLENYATLGQANVSIPVYLANPYHFLKGFRVNVECEALQFDSVDFVSSCIEDFDPYPGYQFNDDLNIVNVQGFDTTAHVVESGFERKLFCTLLAHPRDCAQSAPLLFTSFSGNPCEFVDTLGVNTYYPQKLNGELVITDSRLDTLFLANRAVSPGDSTEIPIYITNLDHTLDSLYVELQMPVPWEMQVDFSRIDTAGTCVGNFNYFDYGAFEWPPNLQIAFFEAKASGAAPLAPSLGKRLLFNVIVTADTSVSEDTTLAVAFTNSSTFLSDGFCTYGPILINGNVAIGSGPTFVRGDVTGGDGLATMGDGLMILGYFFGEVGLDCTDAGDVDDNGEVTMGDGLRVLGYYFGDLGSAPEPPFPSCGPDPTSNDELDCLFHQYCMGKAVAAKPMVSLRGAPHKLVLQQAIAQDGILRVPVDLAISEPVLGCAFLVDYDASQLSFVGLAGGEGYDFYRYDVVDEASGLVRIGCIPDLELKDVFAPGEHRVAELQFRVNGSAIGELGLDEVEVVNRSFVNIPVEWVVKTGVSNLPTEFALNQNYPNPFNPNTLIKYDLPVDCQVRLEVYNIVGQRLVTLVNGHQRAGYKRVSWDASDNASGVYFYKLIAGKFTAIKKMVLLR